MSEKNKKKQIAKISVFITSLFVIFLSVTYAFINMTLTGTKRQVLTSGSLSLELDEDENNLTITDAMPMYDEVGMVQGAFTFRLINNSPVGINYIVKLEDITVGEPLSKEEVKYGLTKDGAVTIDFLSTIEDNKIDEGTISGNAIIEYSLRLWIDPTVEDNSLISNKSLSYRIGIEANQDEMLAELQNTVSKVTFRDENLGENCKTYNDGTDTFLVGQCEQNYVWYSGKLWRVVLRNNKTGSVKMVTDNSITTISYNEANNSTFENSYVDQWLNQEFLPTLHDYENYLVIDSKWDATADSSDEPTRPNGTTVINRTVGLLNAYEYYTTYNNSDGHATCFTNYLNTQSFWWLISEWFIREDGGLYHARPEFLYGVRPSVNLKPEVQIISGNGTESSPYKLDKEKSTIEKELLNTRYSGEYIKFNNELYRIVGVENNLTKIVAVKKPSTLSNGVFHGAEGVTNFEKANIKKNLENYYQGLAVSVKNMIEPNTTWYLGMVDFGKNYKLSICTTVDTDTSVGTCTKTGITTIANIGLPRMGEMFSSRIERSNKSLDDMSSDERNTLYTWVLTPRNASYMWYVDSWNVLFNDLPTNAYGARPSMYLKQNVVIAKDNTGDGTYEHPYDIELGA